MVDVGQGRVSGPEVDWKSFFINFDDALNYFLKNALSGDKIGQVALQIADVIKQGADHIRAKKDQR